MKAEVKIYVGTYGKYNNGSIQGEWLDLSDYSDMEELQAAMAELHSDESDPEYMFQDYECPELLKSYIGESFIKNTIFEAIEAIEASHLDFEVLEAFANVGSYSTDDISAFIEACEEAYTGEYGSDEEFAQEMAEEIGAIDEKAGWPNNCIDWERAARELMYDYSESNGHYFRSI